MADELPREYPPKPWWAPDAQGFTVASVILMTAVALFWRMGHPTELNDKLLDMMLTLLFGTAFVGIVNFQIGSSRGSQAKDDSQNRVFEKLTSTGNGVKPSVAAPVVVVAWWSKLTPAEQATIAGASTDPKVQAFIVASKIGKATPEDLAYLVTKNLLTQTRSTEIQKES